MSVELEDKKRHLKSLDEFIKSPAYRGYVSAVGREIKDTCDSIIAITPDTLSNIIEELQLRGELRCLKTRLTMFEEARDNLSDRIDEMAEAELENATQVK